MWWADLGTLAALRRAGTMERAGRLLGVDKATVSRRISAMERASPRPLFERRRGAIELTAYGERAIAAYDGHERSKNALVAALEELEDEPRGTVRVTTPTFFACELVIPALASFLERRRGLDVFLYGSNRVLDVVRGEADVALRNVRPGDGALSAKKLGRLGMAMFAAPAYLVRRGTPTTGNVAGHDLLVYEGGAYGGPGFEWLPDAARKAHGVFSANDSLPLREAARAGLGLAVLPDFLGREDRSLLRVPGMGGTADLWAVTRTELRRVPRVRDVIGFLDDLVRSNQDRLAPG